MKRHIALLLGLATCNASLAECITTGYGSGSPIPSYVVVGRETLQQAWDAYIIKFPNSARLSEMPSEYFDARPLHQICLVEFEAVDRSDELAITGTEKLVMQSPCDEFSLGDVHRLNIYSYCVELFGRDPDFYSELNYRHAQITEQEIY